MSDTELKQPQVPCPPKEAIDQALKTLRDQEVNIFQMLYFNGLARPGNQGGKYKLGRSFTNGMVTSAIRVCNSQHPQFYFLARNSDEVMDKVVLIEKAIQEGKTEKIDRRACCPLAETRSCVCLISFTCPIHGTQCHGSHD